ncbi:MAG: alpha/beta hydrolase [Ruminococcaceae bacterium]|nr:alpha/beta hydrolase [Oscillospiraceae bacterium]
MTVDVREYKVRSSDGVHDLAGVIYMPQGDVRGYFHVVHGMTEYMGRYDRFMREMAEHGYICFGYDHLGHGHTASNDSELGYIAKKDGWDALCRDVKVFSDAVMTEFPHESAPYILMGHSMGSFIVRLATGKYVFPDKLIVMGTAGPNPAANAGLALIGITKIFKGDKHVSKLINGIAFGSYNKRFEDELQLAPAAWLTTDASVRQKYAKDKFCTFGFTVSGMGDLIRLIKKCNLKKCYSLMPKTMPILLVAGEDDPVGNYGKGVLSVHKKMLSHGLDAKCILYKGARHEILNDFSYEDTKRDIVEFCR